MKRYALLAGGWLALLLAVLGVILPGLPATPFILLAAMCFARSSPRLHQKMREHRWLGPPLRDWEKHRSLPLRIKRIAIGMMLLMVGISTVSLHGAPWAQVAVLAFGAFGAWAVRRVPTRQ